VLAHAGHTAALARAGRAGYQRRPHSLAVEVWLAEQEDEEGMSEREKKVYIYYAKISLLGDMVSIDDILLTWSPWKPYPSFYYLDRPNLAKATSRSDDDLPSHLAVGWFGSVRGLHDCLQCCCLTTIIIHTDGDETRKKKLGG
jgi:hypothetical protein